MRKAEPVKYTRAIAAFIGVLILFQAFTVYFITSAQRKLLLQAEHNNISLTLKLMEAFVREPILSHDYVMIERFLLHHGEECKWAVELKATAPNGFVLAHYKRHKPAVSVYKLDRKIKHADKHLITLSIIKDMEPVETILGQLRFGLIITSILLTTIMGFSLWFILRKMALVPLEKEIELRKKTEEEREKLIKDLTEALAEVKTLSGLLPICASCKKIRDDKGYWNQIEEYIRDRSEAEFSHSICPECAKKLYPDFTGKSK